MQTYTIELLTSEWNRNSLISLIVILVFLWIGKRNTQVFNLKFAKGVALFLALLFLVENSRYLINGTWNLADNLPLQLCSISRLLCCIVFFVPRKQFVFELLFFFGIVGGLQSIFTPQINHYDGGLFHYFEYYCSHLVIICMPIFMYLYLGFELKKNSWLKSFLVINLLLVIVMPLNFYLDANYMYLNAPPKIDNPFIIGDWPYYLIVLEFFAAGLFYMTYRLFLLSKPKQLDLKNF